MAKAKRDGKGYYRRYFMYEGTRYTVYARNVRELPEKEEAKKKEIEEAKKQKEISLEDHSNPTLDDFYKTFTARRRGRIEESTIRCQKIQYEMVNSVEVMPGVPLGKMRIKDIKPADIENVQKELQERSEPRPLTACTINNTMNHLKHVFNVAIRLDFIEKSPCRTLESVQRTEPEARTTIHRALTRQELDLFFEGARERGSYYEPLFSLMANTGVRVGEAGGITEDEITSGRVRIVRTIAKNEIGGYHFQRPKTAAGRRDIPLNTDAAAAITRQRKWLSALGLDQRPDKIIPKGVNPDTNPSKPPLFCSPEGALLRDYAVDREIARICKAKGIRRFTSHALRDTFATLYVQMYPTQWKTLQHILGHKDADTTLNIYVHSVDSEVEETMKHFSIRA